MNSPYFQEGNVPPLCEEYPQGFAPLRDKRSPAMLFRPVPSFWKRPWRRYVSKSEVLQNMLQQFEEEARRVAPNSVDNSLFIKVELLQQRDFDDIFNPCWGWIDGLAYRVWRAFRLLTTKTGIESVVNNIYERMQVL